MYLLERLRASRATGLPNRSYQRGRRWGLRLIAVSFDPRLDIVELETEVSADPVVGDGIVVSARGASIDEGLRNSEDLGDLLDVQVANEGELQLLRLRRLIASCHALTSTTGKLCAANVARAYDEFRSL